MAKEHTYQSQQFGGVIVIDPKTDKKRIKINSAPLYQHFLNTVCKLGDKISLNITNQRPKRSLLQNNYLFLYLTLISSSCGHSVKELDTWARGKFLSKGITEVFGDKVRIVKSHKELNVSEFIEFLARIEEATEIPLPDTEPFLKSPTNEEYAEMKGKQKSIYEKLVAKIKI